MSKPYSKLREKMKPAARKKATEKTKSMLAAMPLQELRHARNLSQEQLARSLSVKQAAVSKLEQRTDMYISTLRNFPMGPFRSANLRIFRPRRKRAALLRNDETCRRRYRAGHGLAGNICNTERSRPGIGADDLFVHFSCIS
jgi:DNA-binding XRE family transcriptional regulator